MSAWLPAGNGRDDRSASAIGGSPTTVVSAGMVCSIDAAQQAHVHRTQNAGQPLSGADSLVPIGQVSGTRSELTPLASATSTASTAAKNARRIPVKIFMDVEPEAFSIRALLVRPTGSARSRAHRDDASYRVGTGSSGRWNAANGTLLTSSIIL